MSKRVGFALLLLIVLACKGEHYSEAKVASVETSETVLQTQQADTLLINPEESEIDWKGTKMWGCGMDTGIVPIRSGYLLMSSDRLRGGAITADMTAIGITTGKFRI